MRLRPESRTILERLYDSPEGYDPQGIRDYQLRGPPVSDRRILNRALKELREEGLIESPVEARYTITTRGQAEVQRWRSTAGRFERSRLGQWMQAVNSVAGSVWERIDNIAKLAIWIGTAVGAGAIFSC